jgi:glycosidase
MKLISAIIFVMVLSLFNGRLFAQNTKQISAPEWSKNLSIYEVNLRQYSKEGTIKAFLPHLPRLKEMGVGILWLMPINPIGEINRKGSLGSYYAVKDYYGLNAEFGTKEDFALLVKEAHKLGMYLIIDWVANHTSWDNALAKTNPDFFKKDSSGKFIPPVPDWKDVIALNYENKKLWDYMSDAMAYWVKTFDIDGFRCDVAGMVPTPFWQYARPRLEKVKHLFMLAEWEKPELHENAFDMTYGWDVYHAAMNVAKGEAKAYSVVSLIQTELAKYPKNAYRMRFTTNHDENSWNGTAYERFGKATDAASVLMATIPGMYLVYSGQEAGETKRLNFFDRDPIDWNGFPNGTFYKNLITLKHNHKALWNGEHGGDFIPLTDSASSVIAFARTYQKQAVIVLVNLTAKAQSVIVGDKKIKGVLTNYFTGEKKANKSSFEVTLPAYEYQVWIKE